jgi:hypothetical protein
MGQWEVTILFLIDEPQNSSTVLILQGEFDKLCWKRFCGRNKGGSHHKLSLCYDIGAHLNNSMVNYYTFLTCKNLSQKL